MQYSLFAATKIAEAELFAKVAHGAIGQVRKYTNTPYIEHPIAVAEIVKTVPGHTWQQIAIALLHDVVEDTQITNDMIRDQFGDEVADGVGFLTNVPASAGNRRRRFELNLERLAKAPGRVQTVKVADLYHNTFSIVKHDPSFAPVYLREKEETLGILGGADTIMWKITWELLQCEKAKLAKVS